MQIRTDRSKHEQRFLNFNFRNTSDVFWNEEFMGCSPTPEQTINFILLSTVCRENEGDF